MLPLKIYDYSGDHVDACFDRERSYLQSPTKAKSEVVSSSELAQQASSLQNERCSSALLKYYIWFIFIFVPLIFFYCC